MKVKELIEVLKRLPEDTEVYRAIHRDCADPKVESVEVEFSGKAVRATVN